MAYHWFYGTSFIAIWSLQVLFFFVFWLCMCSSIRDHLGHLKEEADLQVQEYNNQIETSENTPIKRLEHESSVITKYEPTTISSRRPIEAVDDGAGVGLNEH